MSLYYVSLKLLFYYFWPDLEKQHGKYPNCPSIFLSFPSFFPPCQNSPKEMTTGDARAEKTARSRTHRRRHTCQCPELHICSTLLAGRRGPSPELRKKPSSPLTVHYGTYSLTGVEEEVVAPLVHRGYRLPPTASVAPARSRREAHTPLPELRKKPVRLLAGLRTVDPSRPPPTMFATPTRWPSDLGERRKKRRLIWTFHMLSLSRSGLK